MMMSKQRRMDSELFYELLRVALGTQEKLSRKPTEEEWRALFVLAEQQAVDGVAYHALECLAKQDQKPPEEVMLDWFSFAEQIKEENGIVNRRCKEVTELFAKAGYKTCILKGQGNGMMYPNPLLRVPGDIDIWVKGDRKKIKDFVRARYPDAEDGEVHIQFPIFDDVPVEVHYTLCKSLLPRLNERTQTFFEAFQTEEIHRMDDGGKDFSLTILGESKNMNFQILHMMKHFFRGGIGFRQMIDYFYLLRYALGDVRRKKEDVRRLKEEVAETFEYLGLRKFAGAVMWILKEVLGMDEQYLIVSPDEKRGRLVLSEIMEGGNFGKYDKRWTKQLQEKSHLLSNLTRNVKAIPLFPEEAILTPIMGAYSYWTKKWFGGSD